MICIERITKAAKNPRMENTVDSVSGFSSSSSSSATVRNCKAWLGATPGGCKGDVGGASCTVALGSEITPVGAPTVFNGIVGAGAGRTVGAPVVFKGIVGAGAGRAVGAPTVFKGIVGAGAARAVGAPTTFNGIVGAEEAVPNEGAVGEADATGVAAAGGGKGTARGASAAFSVTRTVSFFKGTLDVCLVGSDGWFSGSVMEMGLR